MWASVTGTGINDIHWPWFCILGIITKKDQFGLGGRELKELTVEQDLHILVQDELKVSRIYGRFTPLSVRPLDVLLPRRFAPWTFRPLDVSPPGRFATMQWTIHPLEW